MWIREFLLVWTFVTFILLLCCDKWLLGAMSFFPALRLSFHQSLW
jgi:hypothetical protein